MQVICLLILLGRRGGEVITFKAQEMERVRCGMLEVGHQRLLMTKAGDEWGETRGRDQEN